jgi:hypothetical protein
LNLGELLSTIRSFSQKGAKAIVPLVLAVLVFYPWIDRNFLAADRLLDQIQILHEYNDLDSSESVSPESQALYEQIKSDVERLTEQAATPLSLRRLVADNLGKFISGAALFVIAALFAPFTKSLKPWQRVGSLLLSIALALVGGLLGAMVPTFGRVWVNWIGFPALELALIYSLMQPKVKARATQLVRCPVYDAIMLSVAKDSPAPDSVGPQSDPPPRRPP